MFIFNRKKFDHLFTIKIGVVSHRNNVNLAQVRKKLILKTNFIHGSAIYSNNKCLDVLPDNNIIDYKYYLILIINDYIY